MCVFVWTEQLEPVHQTKHSSSAVDVTACFSQVQDFWSQLAWPDSAGAFIFVTRLTDVSGAANAITLLFTPSHTHTVTTTDTHSTHSQVEKLYRWQTTIKDARAEIKRQIEGFTLAYVLCVAEFLQ